MLVVQIAAYGLHVVRDILVLIALLLAVSLEPVVRWLMLRGMPRSAAVGTVVAVLIAAFVWSVVPPIVDRGGRLVNDLPGYLHRLSELAGRPADHRSLPPDRAGREPAGQPRRRRGRAFPAVHRTVAATVTLKVLTIFFMADVPRLRSGVVRLLPHRQRGRVTELVDVVVDEFGGYMTGNIIISLPLALCRWWRVVGGTVLGLAGAVMAIPIAATVKVAMSPALDVRDAPPSTVDEGSAGDG